MSEEDNGKQVAKVSNLDSITGLSQAGERGEENKKEEKMKMSVDEKKVEAQTEKKPAGDDAVVLLGKKLDAYCTKLDGVITKMESIEQELGKVKVAAPKKEEAKKPEEAKKEDEGCPPWAKEIGKKLDDLLKVKKEEAKKDEDEDEAKKKDEDEDEAKKKVKKTEAKKKQPSEEDVEEEDEPTEEEDEDDAEAKKKVKGASVDNGEAVRGATTSAWYDEIKAASKKYFPDLS